MTLNQVIQRIKSTTLAHKQIREFYYGLWSDSLNGKRARYPMAMLLDADGTNGSIDLGAKSQTLSFRFFILDMVNVSERAKENEQDVISDALSIVKDLLAEWNYGTYTDWKVSASNAVNFIREAEGDMVAGVMVNVGFTIIYGPDVCSVPTEAPIITEDMKLVYNEPYTTTGTEGSTLNVPAIIGKKILFVTRENAVIYPVNTSPESSEYTWNGEVVGLGTPVNPGERFLFLYRSF